MGWSIAGLVAAVALIAGSVAALDRRVLGHDDWGRAETPAGGVIVLHAERTRAGDAPGWRSEPAPERPRRPTTGGTAAPEPRPSGVRSERRREVEVPAVRVRAPVEAPAPAVARTVPDDRDGDGLTNRLEAHLGTDPRSRDSDGDALPDGWEEQHSLDPVGTDDLDGDGLANRTEFRARSNPRAFDTDQDGVRDGGPEVVAPPEAVEPPPAPAESEAATPPVEEPDVPEAPDAPDVEVDVEDTAPAEAPTAPVEAGEPVETPAAEAPPVAAP